jgi:hypothetical protein
MLELLVSIMENIKNTASLVSSILVVSTQMPMIQAAGDAPLFNIMRVNKRIHAVYPGLKLGKLTVIREIAKQNKHGKNIRYVECLCDCGKITQKQAGHLFDKNYPILHCGCSPSNAKNRGPKGDKCHFYKHGMSQGKSKLFEKWCSMKNRTEWEGNIHWDLYGGRGITVCDEWRNDFMVFHNWAITHGYKEGLLIDRIDVNGNYEPSNCRFVNRTISGINIRKRPLYGIYRTKNGKYEVMFNRYKKYYYVGTYDRLDTAIIFRDKFVENWNKENNIEL